MTVEQKTYLGASIVSVNSSLGWGSSPSSVQVTLVEDPSNGDSFIDPGIGVPTYFDYGSLSLGGLITSIQRNVSTSGNPLFSVTIEDPREILNGVQLIINGYTGSIFNVPNLYNIFGYLESVAFGNAGVNDSGIQWYKIRDSILTLQQTTPLKLDTWSYKVDLTNLPVLPDYYRISGDTITLMDFISEICDAASHDFFFNLENVNSQHIIKLYTINRSAQPTTGNITTFIQSQDQVVSSSVGIEFRNETSSKFLVGGNKTDVFYNYPNLLIQPSGSSTPVGIPLDPNNYKREQLIVDESIPPSAQYIWPFWGVDDNNNVIIGNGSFLKNEHSFTLSSKGVNVVGIGDTYETDLLEMRSAIDSSSSWETMLNYFNGVSTSPHYLKGTKIGLIKDLKHPDTVIAGKTDTELEAITPLDFVTLTGKVMDSATYSLAGTAEENQNRLYQYVSSFANEYYGKRFMVRIPDVQAKLDDDGNVVTNLEPTDGGYIDSVLFSGIVGSDFVPMNINDISLDDNRIQAYVKFHKAYALDLSELSTDDYVLRTDTKSVFIKCSLDPQLYFLNYSNAFSPRVVIELPGKVTPRDRTLDSKKYNGLLNTILTTSLVSAGKTEAEAKIITDRVITRLGGDSLMLGMCGLAQIPDMAACPLKSNVDFYGPWYSVGAVGKTEMEKDDSLVPWNYGGYAAMDLAANARVSSALSQMQFSEGGTLELPGLPSINMGFQLVNGGPYITDISIAVSPQGVTTTYRMQTWTPRLGKIPKQFADNVQKIKQRNVKLERNIRASGPGKDFYKNREFHRILKTGGKTFVGGRPRRKSSGSTNPHIAGEVLYNGSGYRSNVMILPGYHTSSHLASGYENKAVGSLDTLFVPFTTDHTSVSGLPHFELYEGTETINGSSLNPFTGSNFQLVSKSYPDENVEMHNASGYPKAVGLRGPVIIGGWGYDLNGNPVPNSGDVEPDGDTSVFVENYKNRIDLHKVGPLDVRWDSTRKLWSATGGGILHGKIMSNIAPGGSGLFRHYAITTSGEHWNGTEEYVYDWLLKTSQSIIAGASGLNAFVGIDSNTRDKYILEVNCV